jgi:hypothetical protein
VSPHRRPKRRVCGRQGARVEAAGPSIRPAAAGAENEAVAHFPDGRPVGRCCQLSRRSPTTLLAERRRRSDRIYDARSVTPIGRSAPPHVAARRHAKKATRSLIEVRSFPHDPSVEFNSTVGVTKRRSALTGTRVSHAARGKSHQKKFRRHTYSYCLLAALSSFDFAFEAATAVANAEVPILCRNRASKWSVARREAPCAAHGASTWAIYLEEKRLLRRKYQMCERKQPF